MKHFLLYCCVFGFLSSGLSQQTINGSIMHDNVMREYILYVPASYDGTTEFPLLFNFHGYTSNASQQMIYGDFRPIADTANFLVVHPEGLLDNNGTTHFNVGFSSSNVDDVGFTEALLDTLIANYEINQDRVYSTGMSNGGYMSYHLACNLSNRFAAVASVTGAMVTATLNTCGATHMTPVLQIHGTQDATVPYDGNVWSSSIPDVMNHWATFNGCSTTPIIETVPDINIIDGSTVERHRYENADGCTLAMLYRIENGGHTWPGSVVPLPSTNYDIDASLEVWNFLSQFDITGVNSNCEPLSLQEESLSTVSIYPNPTSDLLLVNGLLEEREARLIDVAGQELLRTTLDPTHNSIDVSKIASGGYILIINSQSLKVFVTH